VKWSIEVEKAILDDFHVFCDGFLNSLCSVRAFEEEPHAFIKWLYSEGWCIEPRLALVEMVRTLTTGEFDVAGTVCIIDHEFCDVLYIWTALLMRISVLHVQLWVVLESPGHEIELCSLLFSEISVQ
jgi:hypothetical protein